MNHEFGWAVIAIFHLKLLTSYNTDNNANQNNTKQKNQNEVDFSAFLMYNYILWKNKKG